MSNIFTGRAVLGPDTFQGVVMTRNLVTQQYMNASLQAFVDRVGKRVDEHLASFGAKATPAKPVTFKNGVPIAAFSAREVEALVDNIEMGLGIVNEYSENVEDYVGLGMTLMDFAKVRYSEEYGNPMAGCPSNMRPELKSAFEKQSEIFAARYGNGRQV